MSPRRTRLAARIFRGESVAFEACRGFRAGVAEHVCHCGWPADDHRHTARAAARRVARRDAAWRRAPLGVVFARRAS